MPPVTPARRLRALLTALLVAGAAVPVPAVAPNAAAATDRLPDLLMAPLSDLRIEVVNGRRLLRFTATMYNGGVGPFEVRSTRSAVGSPWRVDQIVYDSAGGARAVRTPAVMTYGGDGHVHWHVAGVVQTDMWATTARRVAKIGFCFWDTTPVWLSLPGAPRTSVYVRPGCGQTSSLATRMGLSVGWGDTYPWSVPYQWVDITGLPGGTYTIRPWVDGGRLFLEGSDTNNCSWSRVRFGSTGSTVTVVSSGLDCVNDYSASVHAADIRWVLENRIVTPCGLDLYCPGVHVTRAQVARWLARYLRLPATTTDFYDDDDGHGDEAAINRLAQAGFAIRCGPRRYCPNARITRADLAATLARAFAFPATATDYFTDDEGHPREGDINRARAAAVMYACHGTAFCPSDGVTRGAFAAYLHRAAT